MSSPIFWRPENLFYPLGNTPAVCLTRDLSSDQSADVLVLGCGDPRHILYTCYSDVVSSSDVRKIDVTCCDLEPAILARNVLLFTLLEEKVPVDVIWDIFYHFKIDTQVLNTLIGQSELLCGLSQDMETWRRCSYGSFLAFLDSRTLSELRKYWRYYADFGAISAGRINELRRQHSQHHETMYQGSTNNQGLSRSSGMLLPEAIPDMTDLFVEYWKYGTTSDNVERTVDFNPTFVYSSAGESFNPHSGTFPQGFHLASAYVPISSDPTQVILSDKKNSPIDVSKRQFRAWCHAFGVSRKAEAIIIRSYAGDALSFCRALDYYTVFGSGCAGLLNSQWHASQIDLDQLSATSSPTPTTFDVIDTSNLANHLGLHNILIAARPLLKKRPISKSILYTEELKDREEIAIRPFLDRLCASIPTLATLLGLAPLDYLSGFTSHSSIHETFFGAPTHLERVTWVVPAGGDRYAKSIDTCVAFDASELACLMLEIYDKMICGIDDAPTLLSRPKFMMHHFRQSSHYHPESLAVMLQLIKRYVRLGTGTWDNVVEQFLGMLNNISGRPLEDDKFQELCLQLHLHGVYTTEWLKPDWRTPFAQLPLSDVFKDWPDIPPVLCVVLTVPRKQVLKILGKAKPLSTITLQCVFRSNRSSTPSHSSIRCVWGALSVDTSSETMTLQEDPLGVDGKSDLVVSFWAASHLIAHTTKTVGLGLIPTPDAMRDFSGEIGKKLEIFKARLDNKKHVNILAYQPGLVLETRTAAQSNVIRFPDPLTTDNYIKISASIDLEHKQPSIESFTARVEIDSSAERIALLDGVNPFVTQVSPCSMKVSIGHHDHIISYPYSIAGSGHRLRVARKSHYLEVIVPISGPRGPDGYTLDRAPVLRYDAYSPWNIHHINLDRMPLIDFEDPDRFFWLEHLGSLQMSDRERGAITKKTASGVPDLKRLAIVKWQIESIISTFCGRWGEPREMVFKLSETSSSDSTYAILLVGGIRLDLASFTVVIEAAIVPISKSTRTTIYPRLSELTQIPYEFPATDGEADIWKRLLPACVERARTWKHAPNCDYDACGKMPVSLVSGEDFICSCGVGIGFDAHEWRQPGWAHLLPFATRAAIPLLFSVPYLESTAESIKDMRERMPTLPSEEEQPARSQDAPVCWACGSPGKPELLACSGCKIARYCSPDCQRKDWKYHKKDCKMMPHFVAH